MSENKGGSNSKLVIALIINAVILLFGFFVLLFIFLDGKKNTDSPVSVAEETSTSSVSLSTEEAGETSISYVISNSEVEDAREKRYLEALQYVSVHDSEKALRIFNTMTDYKDSLKYIDNIGKYENHFKFIKNLDFDEAIRILNSCEGIYDSEAKIADYKLLKEADDLIMIGDFNQEKEKELYNNIKSLSPDEIRFVLLTSKSKVMMYLGSLGKSEEVGKYMAEICPNVDWLRTLSYGEEHRVHPVAEDGSYYGAPGDPAYSENVYGPLYNGEGTIFIFFRDEAETDYFYSIIYGYTDPNGKKVYVTGYFETDGTVKDWFTQ